MYTQRYYSINNYYTLRRGEVLLHPGAKATGFSRPPRSTSIIATKKYVISHLESRVCHLRKYSMQIEYRIDGIVKVKCETILGEVLNTSIPYVIEEVIYE